MTAHNDAWERFARTTTVTPDSATDDVSEPATIGNTLPRHRIVPGEIVASTFEETPRPRTRVEVGPHGAIQLHDDTTAGRETVSEVTGDTFYVNLDAIAEAVKAAQRNDGEAVDPSKRVFVGREGEMLLGNEATGGDRIAEVTGDTFYALSRLEAESAFARTNMPGNTVRVSDGTYDGWHFTITNEFGDAYGLFLYYHRGYGVYRVALVEPRLGGSVDAHGGHLWPDGTLCLTHRTGSGYPSMGATYAKAALWTRGASCYRRGYGFQFNIGQD